MEGSLRQGQTDEAHLGCGVSVSEYRNTDDPPPRQAHELFGDDSGQLVTEWALVTAAVVVPLGLLLPGALIMMRIYFYRIAGTIVLPFP